MLVSKAKIYKIGKFNVVKVPSSKAEAKKRQRY